MLRVTCQRKGRKRSRFYESVNLPFMDPPTVISECPIFLEGSAGALHTARFHNVRRTVSSACVYSVPGTHRMTAMFVGAQGTFAPAAEHLWVVRGECACPETTLCLALGYATKHAFPLLSLAVLRFVVGCRVYGIWPHFLTYHCVNDPLIIRCAFHGGAAHPLCLSQTSTGEHHDPEGKARLRRKFLNH